MAGGGPVADAMVTRGLPMSLGSARPLADNGGRAWRAYLRVITISDAEHRSDGWSTNGQPGGSRGAHASLIVRVTAGESFTIVATLAQNMVTQQPTAIATYRLAVTELSP
jgi:hypothetical protein